ncbi:MAG: kinase, partial [Clostridia bacterium]|nr:kinase [Clostridia bacterium]
MRIAVLGGLNLDLLAKPDGSLKLHDSNPGQIGFSCGGVAHNAAAGLMRLGHSVRLFTAMGTDAASQMLTALCGAEGLPIEAVSVSEGPGCAYLCLHEDSGDMFCAVNDMRAMDAITPEKALSALSAFSPEALVLDTNLPEATLTSAAEAWAENNPVFLDT